MRQGRIISVIGISLIVVASIVAFAFGGNNAEVEDVTEPMKDVKEVVSDIENQTSGLAEPIDNSDSDIETICEESPFDFNDILGFRGCYKDEINSYDGWTSRTYYAYTNTGEVPIAESFSFFITDMQLDIDGDGNRELLCNCVYGADSHYELYVYKIIDGVLMRGYVNWMDLKLPGLFFWGCNAVQTYFDMLEGKIAVVYYDQDRDEYQRIYCDSDIIRYEAYGFDKEFPGVDIGKAYEKYGELGEKYMQNP